jgi:hypothetical protein
MPIPSVANFQRSMVQSNQEILEFGNLHVQLLSSRGIYINRADHGDIRCEGLGAGSSGKAALIGRVRTLDRRR